MAVAIALPTISPAARAESFVNFESGQVRPLAISPGGTRLFAVNTPDNRLEVFDLAGGLPVAIGSVPVGLEPVAVAARSEAEVWVVNHLSDSISIVDVAVVPPRVVRTLLVGDEPRDIVFAGPGGGRAFVTAAHRGQNRPGDPGLRTPGIGRADVWVFDAAAPGAALGGTPLTILQLFGDTPRALAVTPDGSTVYAAVFHSGNRTTAVSEGAVCNGGASAAPCNVFGVTMPGGLPAPNVNRQGLRGPETGLVVRFDEAAGQWRDPVGRNWNPAVRFSLPDWDLFRIDANAVTPVETGRWSGVGTILFGIAVNPQSGRIYVSNTEARNEVRFEGAGLVFGNTSVRGHLHESRITVIDGDDVLPRHLNPHVNYAVVPSPVGTRERSLATPTGMAVSADGGTLYVAAFGSDKVGVLSTAELEGNALVPDEADHVPLAGGGPSGLVLDEARNRLYVLTRFDDAVSVVDTATATEIAHLPLHDPEPAAVRDGRPTLYSARTMSSNGEASCSACHVFGDLDSLAWDLGNPDEDVLNNPNPIEFNVGQNPDFHPLKGPMTTQSLRGMADAGPMHWRGDRTAGNDPGGQPLDEHGAFEKFNPAFVGLLGRRSELPAARMSAFADFALSIAYPPNPVRSLDGSLSPAQAAGRAVYLNRTTDGVRTCNGCHALDPSRGFFGTDGETTFENEPQMFKVAHLRNAYAKVGMFGMPQVAFVSPGNNGFTGDQVRGFGYLHDGSIDSVDRFLSATVFNLTTTERSQLVDFVLAFDTNLAPAVGQQVTRTAAADAAVDARIDLLTARAAAGDCELVVHGTIDGEQRGWRRGAGGGFRSDRTGEPVVGLAELAARAAVPGQELTFSCVPPGSGRRIGTDRDGDGSPDRDEIDAGSDPLDPANRPGDVAPLPIRTAALLLRDDSGDAVPDPSRRRVRFTSTDPGAGPTAPLALPAPGSADDPRVGGASFTVHNAGATGLVRERTSIVLPASGWHLLGTPGTPLGYVFRRESPGFPIRKVVLRPGSLRVEGGGASWGYALDAPSQARVAVRVAIGAGRRLCAVAGPDPGAPVDRPGAFRAAAGTPAPQDCAAL